MRKLIVRFANWLISRFDPDVGECQEEPLPKTLEIRRYGQPPVAATPVCVRGLVLIVRDAEGKQFAAPADECLDRRNWGRWWRHLGGCAQLEDGTPYDPSQ